MCLRTPDHLFCSCECSILALFFVFLWREREREKRSLNQQTPAGPSWAPLHRCHISIKTDTLNIGLNKSHFPRTRRSHFAQGNFSLHLRHQGSVRTNLGKMSLKIIHSSLGGASLSFVCRTFPSPRGSQYTGLNP